MKFILSIILSVLFVTTYSQSKKNVFDHVGKKYSYKAKTHIYQSQRIADITNDIVYNKSIFDGIVGYRIQIYSGSSNSARKNALQIISKFRMQNNYIEPYLVYKNPNFKVRVGDFRTKTEAMRALQDIQKNYNNAFIVQSVIKPNEN